MATFAIIAEHPPELCPTSNAQTRQMMNEGAAQIPQLAEQLGVDISPVGPDDIVRGIEQMARGSPSVFNYMKKLLAANNGG